MSAYTIYKFSDDDMETLRLAIIALLERKTKMSWITSSSAADEAVWIAECVNESVKVPAALIRLSNLHNDIEAATIVSTKSSIWSRAFGGHINGR